MAMFEIKNCKNVKMSNNTSDGQKASVENREVKIEGCDNVEIDGKKVSARKRLENYLRGRK